MRKEDLKEQYHWLYDDMKRVLTDKAFEVWYNNARNGTVNPMPKNYLRSRSPAAVQKVSGLGYGVKRLFKKT